MAHQTQVRFGFNKRPGLHVRLIEIIQLTYCSILSEFLNKDSKVEFQISMTTEEFKNKLVEIYPILKNKPIMLLKANEKHEVLERLNLAPSCYNAEDIYYSSLGRGKLYIQCVNGIEVSNFKIQ